MGNSRALLEKRKKGRRRTPAVRGSGNQRVEKGGDASFKKKKKKKKGRIFELKGCPPCTCKIRGKLHVHRREERGKVCISFATHKKKRGKRGGNQSDGIAGYTIGSPIPAYQRKKKVVQLRVLSREEKERGGGRDKE